MTVVTQNHTESSMGVLFALKDVIDCLVALSKDFEEDLGVFLPTSQNIQSSEPCQYMTGFLNFK